MKLSTFKTSFGYIVTLFRKINPLQTGSRSIEGIYNYLRINEQLSTSGQPTEAQFSVISNQGFTKVINLAPHGIENSLENEPGVVAEAGMTYVNIPVDFNNPTDDDFEEFKNQIQASQGDRVWVHCAANMRVSAFMYRYRRDVLEDAPDNIEQDLYKIWEPFGVWRKFLAKK